MELLQIRALLDMDATLAQMLETLLSMTTRVQELTIENALLRNQLTKGVEEDMSVGIVIDRGQLDRWSGQLAQDMETWVTRIDHLSTFLLATPDVTLEAAPFNYTSNDVAIVKSAIGDLKQLADLYRSAGTLAVAKDFRTFAKQLIGMGIT